MTCTLCGSAIEHSGELGKAKAHSWCEDAEEHLTIAKTQRCKYTEGRCDDCGWFRRVTTIKFWLNGYQMRVCAECIKPYRKVILR